MQNITLIILAAGNSSRLGQPKQLLLYKNKTLLQHILDESLQANFAAIIVVTGAQKESLEKINNNLKIHFVHNKNWPSGMASSIQCGLQKATAVLSNLDAAVFAVSDQPFVSAALFNNLILSFKTTQNIIAAQYNNTIGTPVLFPAKYFTALYQLSGQEGAKKLLQKFKNNICAIHFPNGEVDIDTIEDYKNLIKKVERNSM